MRRMNRSPRKNSAVLTSFIAASVFLAGCADTDGFLGNTVAPDDGAAANTTASASSGSGQTTERDIEAPEIFSTTEAGLWDGRPSLGGIWVAHPDVSSPERVRVKNRSNGEVVIGALFKRERDNPGPRLQISSDAAQALGILAGAPVNLEVVALKKEVVNVAPQGLDTPPEIDEKTLAPGASTATAVAAAAQNTAAASLPETALTAPYLQAAAFSNEANAERADQLLTAKGLPTSIRRTGSSDRPLWRVVVGPAQTTQERDAALEIVKAAGFADAYPVAN
ncbi:MAG: SPOR domain-containing protein [Roseobacter sp.]